MGRRKIFTKTKHDDQYLIHLLLKRFELEIEKENYPEANLVAHNLFWLYSKEEKAKRKLEDIYISKAEHLIREKNLKEAEKAIKSALELEEENPRFLLVLVKIKGKLHSRFEHSQGVKMIAHKFIQTHYPEEQSLFNLAWRVFKNVQPKDFTQQAIPGAVRIIGTEPSELKTPKVVVLLNKLGSQDMEALGEEKIKELITEIGRATGCSEELIDQVVKFILRR